MSQRLFPARRKDGTFSVASRFSTADSVTRERIQAFVAGWAMGTARYAQMDEELMSLPRTVDRAEFIEVVFDGKPDSQHWKDWMVFVSRDLIDTFPETSFLCFYDLVADVAHPASLRPDSPA
jgi:hypothetical protein